MRTGNKPALLYEDSRSAAFTFALSVSGRISPGGADLCARGKGDGYARTVSAAAEQPVPSSSRSAEQRLEGPVAREPSGEHAEAYGPLLFTRTLKEDGRALILYRRAGSARAGEGQ